MSKMSQINKKTQQETTNQEDYKFLTKRNKKCLLNNSDSQLCTLEIFGMAAMPIPLLFGSGFIVNSLAKQANLCINIKYFVL